jgi:hypothetical protein
MMSRDHDHGKLTKINENSTIFRQSIRNAILETMTFVIHRVQ